MREENGADEYFRRTWNDVRSDTFLHRFSPQSRRGFAICLLWYLRHALRESDAPPEAELRAILFDRGPQRPTPAPAPALWEGFLDAWFGEATKKKPRIV